MADREDTQNKILYLFKKDNVRTIVLVGDHGVGKTWMARNIRDRAIGEGEGRFHIALWLFLNRNYDRRALYENIAHQLSLPSTAEEWEDDDGDDNDDDDNEKVVGDGERIQRLEKEISAMLAEKKCLLILDDEGNKMHANEIKSLLLPLRQNQFKFLITRIKRDSGKMIEETSEEEITVEPLSANESLELLQKIVGSSSSGSPCFESLCNAISEKNLCLPAAVVVIAAKALRHHGEHDSGAWTLISALEEATRSENYNVKQLLRSAIDMLPPGIMIDCCWHSRQFFHGGCSINYNELIAYWIMEGYLAGFDCIENAYEKGHRVLMQLLEYGMLKEQADNCVIMEGTILKVDDHRRCGFDGTARLGLTNVLGDDKWDILGRITQTDGMIKTLCNGKKWQLVSTLLLDGSRLCREVPETFFQRMEELKVLALFSARLKSLPLSLSNMQRLRVLVLRSCDLLENIDHIRELGSLTVLEISGASSLKIIPDDLFKKMAHLRSVHISANKIRSLPTSLFNLSELRWLILRGCSQLEELPRLEAFKNLEVLDLSDATSFTKFHDKTFASVPKLQTLILSQTKIRHLPYFHSLGKLTRLLLSGCSSLSRLPSLKPLSSLQILDLSGATEVKEIQEDSIENKNGLTLLDLSGTAITKFPSNIINLRGLYLRDCLKLERLPCTETLKELEELDLSGAVNLHQIEDQSIMHLRHLRILNLSRTKVKGLPSLSNLSNLYKLLLTDCTMLETLPEMKELKRLEFLDLSGAKSLRDLNYHHLNHGNLREILLPGCSCLVKLPRLGKLEKLEVLDLSGCSALTLIQNDSLEHMTCLRRLNFSETKIESLPGLNNLTNLCHLLLRDCVNLKTLPHLESLSKLEELDLCGAISLNQFQAEFLSHMNGLSSLNLSRTPLVQLPPMSNLNNLTRLSLQGCSQLETVQQLEALKKLEFLDLSGTAVKHLTSLDSLSNLHELLLKDCEKLEGLPHLQSLSHLVVLDLVGTRIKEFPSGISELPRLKHLHLPDMKDIQVDWGKIKRLPEKLNWDQCGISKLAAISTDGFKPSITVSGTKFFEVLEKNPNLWETSFQQFHFSVYSEDQGRDGHINCHRDEFFFEDIYSKTRHLSYPEEHCRSLEISGFSSFPVGIKDALRHAEFVYLIGNKFLSCLSDLGADEMVMENMKGCWIEQCTQMVSILSEKEKDVRLGRSLEILWVSNMAKLKSVYGGHVQSENFKNLKRLYLDCCPMLVDVFSSSQPPENLEILKIKFCDRLKTVFGHKASSECKMQKLHTLYLLELPELKTVFEQNASASCALPKLCTLHLLKLPELKSIGCELPSPRPETDVIVECPKLLDLPYGVNGQVAQ